MAVATGNIVIDGHTYHKNDELPDFGSLVCTSAEGNTRNYEGEYADRYKLPKYDDMETGSSAFLSDNGSFKLYKYYKHNMTWQGNGEVF